MTTFQKISSCANSMGLRILFLALMMGCLPVGILSSQDREQLDTAKINTEALLNMSFEDLMNVRVVTATKSLQHSGLVPATVLVVTKEQIKLRGYRNLGEILNDLPGFMVNDKSDPQYYNAVGVRGIFRQDHFVILLDGIRISSPTNEPLPILENFPIYLAKQIEVVYGPGSALYGADAMAGVINIITIKAGDNKHSLNLTALSGTQGYNNVAALLNKKLKSGLHVSVGGQYSYDAQPDFSKVYKSDFDLSAYKTGVFNTTYGPMSTQQPITNKYEAPVMTYNGYASIGKGGFSMQVLHHYAQVPTSTTMKPDNAVYNKDVFYGQGVTTASSSYTASAGKLKHTTTLVASFYKVNPKSNFRNLYGGMEHGYKYSIGSMIKVEEQLNYSFTEKLNLIGGFTYELFQSVPKSPELQSPVSGKGALEGVLLNSTSVNNVSGIEAKFFPLLYTNIGTYWQGQYFPSEKFSVTAGVRYDKNSRFGSTVNPRVGIVFNPLKQTTIKALYGTAFWAPSPLVSYESYGSFYTQDSGTTYQSAFWHLPNPNLEPMMSQTVEITVNQKIGKKSGLSLTAYRTQIENIIHSVSDNGNTNLYNNKFLGWDVAYIEVPFNDGTQTNVGGNLLINSTFQAGKIKLNTYSSVSYVDAKLAGPDGEEVEQSSITPWQFRLGTDGKWRAFQFSARYMQTGKQRMGGFTDNDNPYERKTINGYSLLNLSAGYNLKNNTTFFINVQNALNNKYRTSLAWDSSNPNGETFNGALQNPLRIMIGVRVGF